jgi:hypothetical protein
MDVIWGKREGKYFYGQDWTGRNKVDRVGKIRVLARVDLVEFVELPS